MSMERKTVMAFDAVPGLLHGFEVRRAPRIPETREQGRARVARELASAGRVLFLKQVHGAEVRLAPWKESQSPEADAAVATRAGLLLAIETADCIPLLLADPVASVVGAAHAGWRGTVAGVVARAVGAMVGAGAKPQNLQAALGPAIGPCCYEVGEDVREAFGPQGAAWFRPGPRGRAHLDLHSACAAQLRGAGVVPEHIHRVADCTSCRADHYPSYRRDGPGCGRLVSFIGWSEPASSPSWQAVTRE
jgi:YfiH family protein